MKKLLIAFAAASFASSAFAGPTCDAPKEKWMKEADFKARIEGQGYKIKQFKITNGNCYEIYGHDKNGKRVEIYYNPETGEPVLSK